MQLAYNYDHRKVSVLGPGEPEVDIAMRVPGWLTYASFVRMESYARECFDVLSAGSVPNRECRIEIVVDADLIPEGWSSLTHSIRCKVSNVSCAMTNFDFFFELFRNGLVSAESHNNRAVNSEIESHGGGNVFIVSCTRLQASQACDLRLFDVARIKHAIGDCYSRRGFDVDDRGLACYMPPQVLAASMVGTDCLMILKMPRVCVEQSILGMDFKQRANDLVRAAWLGDKIGEIEHSLILGDPMDVFVEFPRDKLSDWMERRLDASM